LRKCGRVISDYKAEAYTGCTYRSGGPLIIQIAIPATVNHNEIGSDGKLLDPDKLIDSNIIGDQAIIRFPVYDIDSNANVSQYNISPEIDKIYFNDIYKKDIDGIDSTWTDDSISIPISELKFQSENSPNVVNELRIEIDAGNIGVGQFWCMAVDWVAIEFDAAAPYVLLHGINAQADTWDDDDAPGVLGLLESTGVLFDRFSVPKNDTSIYNAIELKTLIGNFLDPLNAKKVHLIAHSKGGLDAQAMAALNPPFEILSLSTLSTPHLGSVAADLSIIQKSDADDKINSGQDPNGFASDYIDTWTFGQGPKLPGLADLTTYRATEAISIGLRNTISPTFTFGADADLNQNGVLEENESEDLFPSAVHYAAVRTWLVLRDFTSAPILSTVEQSGKFWGTRKVLTYETVVSQSAKANDIVVTTESANPSFGTPCGNSLNNHSTIKNIANIQTILNKTINMR
jgi:pimeloyl-ACP methyl ester carboxylesterase